MALLVLLARHPGRTVTREQIVDAIWDGNHYVAPKAINTAVWTLRQALGDDPESPRYVQTIAKKGYRLIAPVRPLATDAPPADGADAAATDAAADVPGATPDATGPSGAARTTRTARATPGRAHTRRALPLLFAVLLLLVLAAGTVWYRPTAPAATAVVATGPAADLPVATPLTQYPGLEYLGRLSPDGRLLAFAWWQGQGQGQLYLRDADDLAAPPRLISGGAGEVQGLAWSPDGQAIAFVASAGDGRCTLWLYALREQTRRELARCAALFTPSVDWSPDGRWIAYSGEADGAGGLFLLAPDGSVQRRLTTAPPAAMPDHQPAWAPDSQRLAFVRQDPSDGTRDLYETTLDGQVQRLSSQRLYRLHGLSFDAGGQDLVFSTTRQDARVLLRWDRARATAVPLGLEGSAPARGADGRLVFALLRSHVGIARLDWGTAAPQRLITSVASDRAADVHPGSARTVFVSHRSGSSELWQADGDGGGARRLTRLDGVVAAPSWSPGGELVAFLGHCGPGKRFGLCLLEVAEGRVRPLAADAARYGRPAWHPQRAEVWVASDRGGRWQLWRLAADGRDAVAVDTEQPPGASLQWTADGQALIYRPRHQAELRWRQASGGAERRLEVVAAGDSLVDWRLGPRGLVVLGRGTHERFRRVDPLTGRQQPLSEHPLGTFPELATFTLVGDEGVLVDVANTAVADLMQVR